MAEETPFAALLRRIREGDPLAADELVRRYEPAVRLAVRTRLSNSSLQRHFDSVDVCQSVMASFFVRAASGQYDLEQPGQLLALLVQMAKNKFGMQVRRHTSQRRDARRDLGGDDVAAEVAEGVPGPDRVAAARDLLAAVRSRLSDEERAIADLRGAGQTWVEIAAAMGGTAESRRMQLGRALDRIGIDLGLDSEADDE